MPIGAELGFKGVVDLLSMKAFVYEGDSGKYTEADIPAELEGRGGGVAREIDRRVSELDDALIEKFLDGKEFSIG